MADTIDRVLLQLKYNSLIPNIKNSVCNQYVKKQEGKGLCLVAEKMMRKNDKRMDLLSILGESKESTQKMFCHKLCLSQAEICFSLFFHLN